MEETEIAMKRSFPISFLGNAGPEEIIVALTMEEIRDRLRTILREESFVEAMFSTEVHYTGEIGDRSFTLRPCRKPKGAQRPTLIAEMEEAGDRTRIRFHIEAEVWILWVFTVLFIILTGVMVVLMVRFNNLFPACLFPFLAVAIFLVNSLFTRYVSNEMLVIFLELFGKERIA